MDLYLYALRLYGLLLFAMIYATLRYPSIFWLLLLCIWLPAASANTIIPQPPQVAAEGWLLIDFASETVLAEQNADSPLEPASLTKIMTAYVVFREIREGNISLEDRVLVSEKAWKTPGSRMFIEVDTRVTVRDLLHGLMIQSGNDAAVALAEHIAGTEGAFAQLMNSHAARLGMTASNFTNASGLPHPNLYTTPRDIVRVTAAMIREFPEFYQWYSQREYTYNNITQQNRNLLLWRDESVDGVKTGHTEAAGYCLVTSAQRDGMRLISVVMGTESVAVRTRVSLSLLNYGFRFFESYALYNANAPLQQLRVWKGAQPSVAVGIERDLSVAVPRGQFRNIESNTVLNTELTAPIAQGEQVGELKVTLAGVGEIASRPLIALDSVAEGGIWQRAKDGILLYFQ